MTEQERLEELEYRDALLHIKAVLATSSGRQFVKYLFKNLGVTELPELGLTGELMHERLGLTRAALSVFQLISVANSEVAGLLIAEIEKEKHERTKQRDSK